ncbi:related to Gephyrin [Melanopsichium pennsylvanicum]|uniref:Related to Gephyrin n=2 Tax=Melanopsichium pennsylvanicum TaxID=63383 RepID=A0AAJ5C8S3_9BASI|nr:related to Gephyrin [Melanopsichium pennsylvanicum 4]SNX87958.1 related to Gephyrin [Melanopsichium pennsylvanicum]
MTSFKAGILTVSDTASTNPLLDRSGPVLMDALSSAGFDIQARSLCPDELSTIRYYVQLMADSEGVDLIVTTGGTGFGQRDVTPEAVEPLISRKTPALTHALTSYSLSKTPLAALSRAVTGIRKVESTGKEALIVVLPGSPKAVKECLEVLLANGLLKHALELLAGGTGETKHQEMQRDMFRRTNANVHTATDAGCSHHHHGGLHSHSAPKPRTIPSDHTGYRTVDPASGPSLRHRTSPYPLLSLDQALGLIAEHTPPAASVQTLPIGTHLIGHVLAEDVSALSDLPPGPTTNVDGYAVRAGVTPPGEYRVVTLSTLQNRALGEKEIFRINTGQGLPPSTDAVVMVEDTELLEERDGEEVVVKILAQVDVGENVRGKGSDVKEGQVVLRKGSQVSTLGGEIGTLSFLGRSSVKVYKKPKVAILSTGNELQDPPSSTSSNPTTEHRKDWGFRVFDANRPGLHAAITGLGFSVVDLGIATDDIDTTLSALKRGIAEADMVITTGGTSMGESDLLKPLIERQLGGTIHFGRVAMKPGKPTTFATLSDDKTIFALPGNPASALVTFYVFVLPALRKLSGCYAIPGEEGGNQGPNPWSLPQISITLGSEMKLDPRPEFHRAVVKVEPERGLVAYSTGSQRSSGMHSMSCANSLIALPALTANSTTRSLPAGTKALAILLGNVV